MPKFHKEFFHQTEGEDQLILDCLTEKGLTNIFKSIQKQLNRPRIYPHRDNGEEVSMRKVWKCECPFSGNYEYFKAKPKFCAKSSYSGSYWSSPHSCDRFDDGSTDGVREPEDDEDRLKPKEFGKRISGKLYARHSVENTGDLIEESEREVLCKAENGFIIGYADLFLSCGYVISGDLKLSDGHTWTDYERYLNEYDVVIEAKPEIKDTSAVLRQIKTYMDNLKASRELFGAIVTYSNIDTKLIDTLNEENVALVSFEKENQEKNSLDDFVDDGGSK